MSSAGCISGCEFPFPVSSPGVPPLPDDLCVVFVVELDKGPYGLGMGLIDGLVSRQKFKNRFNLLYYLSVCVAAVFLSHETASLLPLLEKDDKYHKNMFQLDRSRDQKWRKSYFTNVMQCDNNLNC